jgi:hypothetical protein
MPMREFFRGWKRKAGCVTLLLACVFAAGWVRSQNSIDSFVISDFEFVSLNGRIDFGVLWRRVSIGIGEFPEYHAYKCVYYWSLVLPLTLLSAYLLVSKQRPPKPIPAA